MPFNVPKHNQEFGTSSADNDLRVFKQLGSLNGAFKQFQATILLYSSLSSQSGCHLY